MELVSHLGLSSGPELTPRTLGQRVWSIIVSLILFDALLYYYTFAAGFHVLSYVAPMWAEEGSNFAVEVYWHIVAFFARLNNYKVTVTGDKVAAESALVVCNHQSLCDYFFLVHLAHTAHPDWRPQVNFFTWFNVWRVPSPRTFANVVSCDENWELSRSLCRSMFQRVITSETSQWVILFPEVNIWTVAAAYSQRLHAKRYCLPFHTDTLYPRYSGVLNAVHTLNGRANIKFSHVYNVTLSYQGARPTLLQLFASEAPIRVTMDVKVVPLEAVPLRRAKLERWLEKTWTDKDRQLAQLREMQPAARPKKSAPDSVWDTPLSKVVPFTRPA